MKCVSHASGSTRTSWFDHPAFENLHACVLRDVADRRLEERERNAAARALAFLLREQFVDEAVATDVLTAIHRALDLSAVLRTLLLGLRNALGDHERMTAWTRAIADRALAEGHLPSFVSAMRILIDLRDYDGAVPTRWRIALLRSIEFKDLAPRTFLFARAYGRRFTEDSWWLRTVRRQSTIACLRRRVTVADMRESR